MMGYRAVFSRRFTKSSLWAVIRKYSCTTFSLVGGMATAIYSNPNIPMTHTTRFAWWSVVVCRQQSGHL